jgi:2-dehydro-3-deoxygluconokinase
MFMDKLVTFGEIMVRLHMKDRLRFRQLPGDLNASFGGAEANVAVSFCLLGGSAAFVTALPVHGIADACLGILQNLGVDVSGIIRTNKGRLGIYFVEGGANQRPSNVIYDRDGSSVALETPDAYDWEKIFSGAGWFHISGITPALSKNAAEVSLAAVKAARGGGLTVSCDLNFRKKLWRWEAALDPRALAAKVMGGILPHVDVLVANEEDVQDVFGIKTGSADPDSGGLDIWKYPPAAEQLTRRFPSLRKIAFTLRESVSATHNNWGAMLYDAASGKACFAPREEGRYKPYPMGAMVDRIGGGDAFSAALIHAMMDESLGRDDADTVSFAAAASCLCHSVYGDFNYTSREEVIALMGGKTSGRIVR